MTDPQAPTPPAPRQHPARYVWRIPAPYEDEFPSDVFHAVDPRNDRLLCVPASVLPASHRGPGRGDSRCSECLDLIVAAQTADAADIEAPGMLHLRTPEVTVELQLRPPVPCEWRPHWWGNSRLSFYPPGATQPARTFDLADLTAAARHRAVVRRHGSFGYVLVLTFTHDHARAVLDRLDIPDHATDVVS